MFTKKKQSLDVDGKVIQIISVCKGHNYMSDQIGDMSLQNRDYKGHVLPRNEDYFQLCTVLSKLSELIHLIN